MDEKTTPMELTSASDSKFDEASVISISIGNVVVQCRVPWKFSSEIVVCPECTSSTVIHFEKLTRLFPRTQIWKSIYYKPVLPVFEYIQEHLWTMETEAEFWKVLHLARKLNCGLIEYAMIQFVQTKLKVHANHFSVPDVFRSFPSTSRITPTPSAPDSLSGPK